VVFICAEKKEKEAHEENMDENMVMAREKRLSWHPNFANGA